MNTWSKAEAEDKLDQLIEREHQLIARLDEKTDDYDALEDPYGEAGSALREAIAYLREDLAEVRDSVEVQQFLLNNWEDLDTAEKEEAEDDFDDDGDNE